MKRVAICSTGIANIASVQAGFKRTGAESFLTEDADVLASADYVMLPGVGSFNAGVERIDSLGLREALIERIESDKPTMAICLGLQLLSEESEEGAGVGLGVLPQKVERFTDSVRVPQFGWNQVEARGSGYLEAGWAYFANSYCLREVPAEWNPAYATYDDRFVAAIERGRVLACQFHPELSGPWGIALMKRWLEG